MTRGEAHHSASTTLPDERAEGRSPGHGHNKHMDNRSLADTPDSDRAPPRQREADMNEAEEAVTAVVIGSPGPVCLPRADERTG